MPALSKKSLQLKNEKQYYNADRIKNFFLSYYYYYYFSFLTNYRILLIYKNSLMSFPLSKVHEFSNIVIPMQNKLV